MIRELGRTARNAVLESVGRAASRYQEQKSLPVDLLESDVDYLAVFDAPGVESSDVDVRFDENTIRVRLERFRSNYDGFELRAPGRGLSLTGSATLPPDVAVDPTDASAVLTAAGTLEVRVPKVDGPDDAAERTVDVETGASADEIDEDVP